MSRSRHKSPFCGVTVAGCKYGEQRDKTRASRKLRHRVRQAIRTWDQKSDLIFPVAREVSDIWCFLKDGKIRFDPGLHPTSMRK